MPVYLLHEEPPRSDSSLTSRNYKDGLVAPEHLTHRDEVTRHSDMTGKVLHSGCGCAVLDEARRIRLAGPGKSLDQKVWTGPVLEHRGRASGIGEPLIQKILIMDEGRRDCLLRP